MDLLTQILTWMIVTVALGVVLCTLNLRGGSAGLVRLFEFLWVGVSAGFFFGMLAVSCADEFTSLVAQQKFWPHWFQGFVQAHRPELDHAPVFGMVFGLGLALADWWIRPKPDYKIASDV
jgi:hypothetical protein